MRCDFGQVLAVCAKRAPAFAQRGLPLDPLLCVAAAVVEAESNLKAAREFIEQALGLITAPAQQQTCGLAFVRQHLLGKDQFTTTRQRVRRTRRRGGVLWLLY